MKPKTRKFIAQLMAEFGTRPLGARHRLLPPLKLLGFISMLLSISVLAAPVNSFPTANWDETPQGSLPSGSSQALDQTRTYLSTIATTSLIGVKAGKVFFSYGSVEKPGIVASVRKSVLSMLYGRHVEQGLIDIRRTIGEVGIDDLEGLLPNEKQATIQDILTARSGVYHNSSNLNDDHKSAPARGSQRPGSYFLYNNWDFNVAGTIFERLTGGNIFQSFNESFALPLQLQDFSIAEHSKTGDATRSQHLTYHFFLSARDMARLGLLMLNDGTWNGRQLIPVAWVRKTSALYTPAVEMHPPSTANQGIGYGYLWWVLQEPERSPLFGAYMAWGQYGQFILVIPKEDMVIAHKRHIAPSGNERIRRVTSEEFLKAARMLIEATKQRAGWKCEIDTLPSGRYQPDGCEK
jgi:CubicO group peptidase (beta-lactamase class C family)